MENFKYLKKEKISLLPKAPGIYAFLARRSFSVGGNKGAKRGARQRREGGGGVGVLYIGKAANIRERVKSHFQPLRLGSGQAAFRNSLFIHKVGRIGYLKTDSEIEALILEANLIKKYQPKYNVIWRDDKNYFFVGITREDFPRVFWTHQPQKIRNSKHEIRNKSEIQNPKFKTLYLGPFVDGTSLKKTLRILRKIFPYYTQKKHPKIPCSWCHLNLCPGPNPDKLEYRKNIKNLISVLKGKKKSVLKKLKKEMGAASKLEDFEKAAKMRDQFFALENIISHAKIFEREYAIRLPWQSYGVWNRTKKKLKRILKIKNGISRIEAYDVSNIQGKLATGSMVTFIDGKPEKNFYRKFKIRIEDRPNDVAMLKEVLSRRLNHPEWPYPDLILIDGGIAQLSAALKIKDLRLKIKEIKFISLAKKKNKLYLESWKKPILLKNLPREVFNLILQLRDEAHRFARAYHLKLRRIDLLPNF